MRLYNLFYKDDFFWGIYYVYTHTSTRCLEQIKWQKKKKDAMLRHRKNKHRKFFLDFSSVGLLHFYRTQLYWIVIIFCVCVRFFMLLRKLLLISGGNIKVCQ